MQIEKLLDNKGLKPKQKTEMLSALLVNKEISISDLLNFAGTAKDSPKATCIEALEFASRQVPTLIDEKCFLFVCRSLTDKAPRVKWESAKVVGNVAHLFPKKLTKAVNNLLINTEAEGTVVRWATAFALGEIIKLNSSLNKELVPAIEVICQRETENGVKKKYQDALKKLKKMTDTPVKQKR